MECVEREYATFESGSHSVEYEFKDIKVEISCDFEMRFAI